MLLARHRPSSRPAGRPGRSPDARVLLLALLLPLPLLLLADAGHRGLLPDGGLLGSRAWDVDIDRSAFEVLGHLQLGAAALLLGRTARRRQSPVLARWARLLGALVLDDALRLHEEVGRLIAGVLPLPTTAGLREQDLGELLWWAVLGAVLLPPLVAAHRRDAAPQRRASVHLLGLLLLLSASAVVLDLLHAAAREVVSPRAEVALVWLEASGELAAMGALLAYAVHLRREDASRTGERSRTA